MKKYTMNYKLKRLFNANAVFFFYNGFLLYTGQMKCYYVGLCFSLNFRNIKNINFCTDLT